MRTVLRYVDGRAVWSENTPAYAGSIRWGGTTSFGAPGAYEQNRISSKVKREQERAERAGKA